MSFFPFMLLLKLCLGAEMLAGSGSPTGMKNPMEMGLGENRNPRPGTATDLG